MTAKETKSNQTLRRQAEATLKSRAVATLQSSDHEANRTLHELQVHQIELEMQNKELHALQSRLFDLYDQAPVGYCILNKTGLILEANLSAATLLGVAQEALIKQPFSRFILSEDQDVNSLHQKKLLETGKQQGWELRLLHADGSSILTHLLAVLAPNDACWIMLSDITGLKQTELALSESEARYRRITEGLTDYQYTVRLENGRAVETRHSPACQKVTGYSAEEFAADPYLWISMVTPDHRDMIKERVQQILAGQDVLPVEHKIIRKDATVRWVSDNIILFRDEAGALLSYDGVVKDITERHQAEALTQVLLQETQSQYQEIAAFMRASRAVLINQGFEPAARVIFDECKQLLGAAAGYVVLLNEDASVKKMLFLDAGGRPCTVAQDLRLPIRGLRAEACRTGKAVFDNDFKNNALMEYLPEGHVTLDNVLFAPLPVNGKVLGLIGLANKPGGFTDDDARTVTGFGEIAALALAKSRNLESLENSEARFRSLVETASDAIISVDASGCITHWNSGAQKIFGYAAAELIGKDVSLIVPQKSRDAHKAALKKTLRHGKMRHPGLSLELDGLKKDGTEVPVELTVSRWQTREGIFFTSIIRDSTARKRAEAEHEKLQTQLNQAQKMEAIGVLAGGIAHDFNNILGVILGYTEMAREDAGPGSQIAKDLDRVLTSAQRAKDLVKQILAFSRQANVERVPIKIQPLVKESLKMLRASIPSTITIKENIHPQGRVVLADPTQIYQIIMNLCTNAYHAMEQAGGLLSIAVKTIAIDSPTPANDGQILPGEYVLLTVSDTGTGIEPNIIERIFDPYFTTKDIGKGTGMGLAITHGIIKDYGGFITVESTLGLGTTFNIYLPVIQEEAKAAPESQEAPKGQGRILLIDDEEVLLEMEQNMLKRLGYTVTSYSNSIEALEAFTKDPAQFDLVITDQTMPAMTGTDLARRLLMIRPDLPIILCTGFSHLIDEASAKAIGIKEFALKPLTKSSIGQLLRKTMPTGPAE